MSGPRDHFMEGSPLDQFDPKYPIYDNQYAGLQRTSDPSTPYEGFGFWYRPESQETIYSPDTTFSQQARSLSQHTMDSTQLGSATGADQDVQAIRRRNVPSSTANGALVNRIELDEKKTQLKKVRFNHHLVLLRGSG